MPHERLLNSVTEAAIATDLEGRVTYWNRFAEQLYGWPSSEAQGRSILELTSAPQEVDAAKAILDRLVRGESWSGDLQCRNRDGRLFTVHFAGSPIIDDGRVVGTIGVSRDVTEITQAHDALRRRGEQLAEAQRLARVGTIDRDLRTGQEVWTDEIYRIFELDPSTSADVRLIVAMTHPDDRPWVEEARDEALTDGRPFEHVYRAILRSGREISVMISGRVTFEDGAAVRSVAAVQDITAQKRTESEIRRRALQQSALAQVGNLALSNTTLDFIFAQSAQVVREVLDIDHCSVFKKDGDRLLLVGGAGWPEGAVGTAEVHGTDSQVGYTLQVGEPVIVTDLAAETRFTPSPFMLKEGVVGALTVVIEAGGEQPWGVIGATSRKRHDFTASDIDFLRALAATLGQAIERRRAEVELRVRAVQQSAIAELGHLVLAADVDQQTLERACELSMNGLGVEFSSYLESVDDGQSLRFRAGQVWLTPPDPIPMDQSQSGLALKTGKPVIVSDYQGESRFRTHSLFVEYGIRSGLAVPVIGWHRRFGVLSAHTRAARHFGPQDVHFMESLAAVLADAQSREAAHRDLLESEQRFRTVVEGASEIIFGMDTTGRITSLNPAFEVITGWRCEEWVGRNFEGLITSESLAGIRKLCASIMREPRPIRVEAHLRGKRGQEIHVAASVSPKVLRGDVIELYGFARDVTEERRLEAERKRATHQMQLILDSTDEGIYATDVQGRCTLINRSAALLLDASPDWLIGTDMHSLVHPKPPNIPPEPPIDCALLDVVRTAQSHSSRDDTFCRANGTPFPVEYTASPIIDKGEVKGSVVAFSDISARRKLESKLEQANRLSSLGRLAATVAHEFNNVLMGIAPFAEVLRREKLSERGETAIDQIARSVKRGKRITQDILRFTQPSEPVLLAFDAVAWLSTVALEARSLLGTKFIVEIDVPPGPVRVVGDAGQLHQTFINLILNARDAMTSGGRIAVRIVPHKAGSFFDFADVDAPHHFAHFIVEDSGHGMSPETLRHIFEPLFTTKRNGTGLGLAVARHMVTRHGGEIFVESTIGTGTKFHLFIPLADETVVEAGAAVKKPDQPVQRRYQRVLIVEDERPVAMGLAALLELEGIAVRIVETGAEVLPAIREMKPDAVLLDIGLPDMDGSKVYSMISESYPDMPVIYSTGHADESTLEAHLSRPHVAFLLKPYDIETLLNTLDRVVS